MAAKDKISAAHFQLTGCEMNIAAKFVWLLAVVSIASSCSEKPTSNAPEFPMTFDGTSDKLKATEIVPTFDTPIPNGKNAIWCASFLAAWKMMSKDFTQEPISLDGASEIVRSLNSAADPRDQIPEGALYVMAGWKQDGVVERIQNDLKLKFPNKESPKLPETSPDSFIAYSYLEGIVKFALPYCQSHAPLDFVDAQGRTNRINSFGIRPEDHDTYEKLRAQPRVLFLKQDFTRAPPDFDVTEFAVDLCANASPNQIIVARIAREPTLESAVAHVENETALMQKSGHDYLQKIGSTDILLVPDLYWLISHHFAQLEGRAFNNGKAKAQRFEVAQQDIAFRLDKSGAQLISEARMAVESMPKYFVCDRPFLIYMKKRNAKVPYFAMWVDNAELLRAWQENEKHSH